jgi:peroxiredoxin (alkyl hydroperoxide reductase subunit C)
MKHGVATPANWQPGEDVIVPPPGSCGTAKDRVADPTVKALDWFFSTKPCPKG